MRKTINRQALVEKVNAKLAADETKFPYMDAKYREHIGQFVINLLLENEMYKGFLYLEAHHLDNPKEKPGIRRDDNGRLNTVDVDDTRIYIL